MTDIKYAFTNGLQAVAAVFPLAAAMCVCSGLHFGGMLALCAVACLLFPFREFRLSYGGFALVFSCAALCGQTAAFFAVAMSGLLLLFCRRTDRLQRLACPPAAGALTLALALFLTVMQTTLYFGIGATGSTAAEMIRSYVSLGFHGNWRGVLYGTITLVIMITYPRKFKTLCRRIPAPFWCILFTTLLNFRLNPHAETTAIAEVGNFAAAPTWMPQSAALTIVHVLGAILFGAALFVLLAYQLNEAGYGADGKTAVCAGAVCVVCGLCCGLPLIPAEKKVFKKQQAAVSIAVSLLCLFFISTKIGIFFVQRIPIPTLAVILIAGAWQRVDWHGLKTAFTGGVKGVLILVAVAAATLLLNPAAGVLIAALCGWLPLKKAH